MPTPKRRLDSSVIQRLIEQPYRFQFFQAVRVLEHVFVRQGDAAGEVVGKRLRFLNTLNLAFPASEIERLETTIDDPQNGKTSTHHWQPGYVGQLDSVAITPAFFGMLGTNGTLPLTYTERIGERETFHRDYAARAFLDIFSTRATALFYGAWKKYRLALQYELDRKGRLLPLTKALTGLGLGAPTERPTDKTAGDVADEAVAFYCAAVRQRPLSTIFLQRMLSEYFEVCFRIEQFVGGWHDIPHNQRSRLYQKGPVLGQTALLGERVWQRDLRLRLWVGPLTKDKFEDFLPGTSGAKALSKWLTLMAGCSFEYEICLILRADQVQGIALSTTHSARLGLDAFLVTHEVTHDRADACYEIKTLY